MYPLGHARNTSSELADVLGHKFHALASLGIDDPEALRNRFADLEPKTPDEIARLYDFPIRGLRDE
jgi:hypothetical protein